MGVGELLGGLAMRKQPWTKKEEHIIWRNRSCNVGYIQTLLPHRNINSIYQKKYKMKEKYEGGIRVDRPRPAVHKLTMQEGKPYRLARTTKGKDGRSITKEIVAKVLRIYPSFILCELKLGIRECFLRVDLGRTIQYKEVG